MSTRKPSPGVNRAARIDDDGLERLERQLQRGSRISAAVLSQWIRRYDEAARKLIQQYGQWRSEFDDL